MIKNNFIYIIIKGGNENSNISKGEVARMNKMSGVK